MRVYYDRLVDDADRLWLTKFLKEAMQNNFNTNFDELFKHLNSNSDGTVYTDMSIYMYIYPCVVCLVCM